MACNTPSPRFLGITPFVVEKGGHSFDVYRRPTEVQLLRTNRQYGIVPNDVMGTAISIAEELSGCTALVAHVKGDAALMTVPLRC